MTSESQTFPGDTRTIGIDPIAEIEQGLIQPANQTSQTVIVSFQKISHLLSDKELRRPRTPGPTGEELKRIAQKHQPPTEWFEGEDECPF